MGFNLSITREPNAVYLIGSLDATLAANLPATPQIGDSYVISVAGDFEDDASIIPAGYDFTVGDFVIWNGVNWVARESGDDSMKTTNNLNDVVDVAASRQNLNVHTWDAVMHNAASAFTVADTENKSLEINQNDVTNNPAAMIITNTGTGNDITAPNASLINGTMVLGADPGGAISASANSLVLQKATGNVGMTINVNDNQTGRIVIQDTTPNRIDIQGNPTAGTLQIDGISYFGIGAAQSGSETFQINSGDARLSNGNILMASAKGLAWVPAGTVNIGFDASGGIDISHLNGQKTVFNNSSGDAGTQVGIGTSSPAAGTTLHVSGGALKLENSSNTQLIVEASVAAGYAYSIFQNSLDADNAWAVGRTDTSKAFEIRHSTGATFGTGSNSTYFSLNTSGNLGLGTVTPFANFAGIATADLSGTGIHIEGASTVDGILAISGDDEGAIYLGSSDGIVGADSGITRIRHNLNTFEIRRINDDLTDYANNRGLFGIDNNGRVRINTTFSSYGLNLQGGSNGGLAFDSQGVGTIFGTGLTLNSNNGNMAIINANEIRYNSFDAGSTYTSLRTVDVGKRTIVIGKLALQTAALFRIQSDAAAQYLEVDNNGGFQLSTGATITEFSTDGTMAGNSDTVCPTEAAVVTYVANQIATSDTYDELTDTAALVANAIPYTNGTPDQILHSANLTYDGTDFTYLSGTEGRAFTPNGIELWDTAGNTGRIRFTRSGLPGTGQGCALKWVESSGQYKFGIGDKDGVSQFLLSIPPNLVHSMLFARQNVATDFATTDLAAIGDHITETLDAISGDRDNSEFVVRRNIDGASTYAETAAVMRIERTVANMTGTAQDYLACDSNFMIHADGGITIGGATPVAGTKLLLPQELDAATPTIAFGDGDTGIYSSSDRIYFSANGASRMRVNVNGMHMESGTAPMIRNATATATTPVLVINRHDDNDETGIGGVANTLSMIIDGAEAINIGSDLTTGFKGRACAAKGNDIASATAITLGTDGNLFDITGAVTIDHIITTGWTAGSIIVLQFDGAPTVTDNAGGATGAEADIRLEGSANFSAAAGSRLVLQYNGTTWDELSRSVV